MCRLFGFKSVLEAQVHKSLVSAENALMLQSEKHPDGWGVAYYVENSPHVIKSVSQAIDDHIFKKVSGIVSSYTVMAHLRKGTVGEVSLLNSHPFQYGRWTFAHNGNIKNFSKHRADLLAILPDRLKRYILGDTDSELLFFLILKNLSELIDLSTPVVPLNILYTATRQMINDIKRVVGDLYPFDEGPNTENFLTFIITNGPSILAFQGGKELYYSTFKKKCSERETCLKFAPTCEQSPLKNENIQHLLISSEPLHGENVWWD